MTGSNAPQPDNSMFIHKSLSGKLISGDTAIEIARRVLLDQHGELEVERNLPLVAQEDGQTWIVTGTQKEEFNRQHPPSPLWLGPMRMVISAIDAQILSYRFLGDLPWLKPPDTSAKTE